MLSHLSVIVAFLGNCVAITFGSVSSIKKFFYHNFLELKLQNMIKDHVN